MMNYHQRSAPIWIAISLTIVSMIFGWMAYIRAGDIKKIDENTTKIDTLSNQLSRLVQAQFDLTKTVDKLISIQMPTQAPK